MSKKPKTVDGLPTDIRISFKPPEGVEIEGISVTQSGDIVFKGKDGASYSPVDVNRQVTHARTKSPKVRTQQKLNDGAGALGGLRSLSKYDSIFAIDTNKVTINGLDVYATAFICFKLDLATEGYRVVCEEGQVNLYEFHGKIEKPELLGILKLAHDVEKSPNFNPNTKIAIITDTELDALIEINERRKPIYRDYHLPVGFELFYASADTGKEIINKFIRLCDRQAGKHLDELQNGKHEDAPLHQLKEDKSISFRLGKRNGEIIIENPVLKEQTLTPGATVNLYGVKKEN